jgi:uncharacterized protein
MKRAEMDYLLHWKHSKTRKPLIIRGARQVGKTWLMKEFGRLEYENIAYINFESNAVLKTIFEKDFDIKRILLAIRIETGINPEPGKTLIILDEIQEAPKGLTSLKYFHENAPEYHVVAAGSLLGLALGNQSAFPVGKVEFLHLYPFSFIEFLLALNENLLQELIQNQDWPLIKTFKLKFIELLRQYYFVGGMPEAVQSFAKDKNFNKVREIQQQILTAYEQDFSKHAPNAIVPRIRMVWNSLPAQLAKENRKFIYGMLRQGARAKEFELAISWLIDSGLIYKVNNVSKPSLPLKAYENNEAFKLYFTDVGLLAAMTNLDIKTILDGNAIFSEFKGALTEQYVMQQLMPLKEIGLYYWSPENARSEIDFLVQIAGKIIPVEVKAEENLQARSLKVYCQKFHPEIAVRTSMSDFRKEDWLTNVPLYAIHLLPLLA